MPPRSRKGCATCKKRHRKCDETRPTCHECEDNGLQCEGYEVRLVWDVGVASRGFLRGATIPVSRPVLHQNLQDDSQSTARILGFTGSDARGSTTYMHNTAYSNAGEGALPDGDTQTLVNEEHIQHLMLPEDLWGLYDPQEQRKVSATEEEARLLFKQFNESTIFLLYSTSIHDPFPSQLEQVALRCQSLYDILIALRIYTASPNEPPSLFYEFFNRGLSSYREQLELADKPIGVDLLLSGLFICTIHLFQAAPWTAYLSHLMKVLKSQQSSQGSSLILDEDHRFSVEAMAVMDLPTFVRGRQAATLGMWALLRSEEEAASGGGRASGIETMSGLPRSLLDIFAGIEDASSEAAFVNWPGEKGDIPHCHLWEAYRLAGILMGRRFRRKIGDQVRKPCGASFASTEVLVIRLMAILDALYESSRQPKHRHILAKNSMLYPCIAVRLEVAMLQTEPALVETLRRYESLCAPYHQTPNEAGLSEILDEALARGDDDVDLDQCAISRGVEFSLF